MTTNNRNVKSSKSETIKCTFSLQNKKICAEKTRIKAIAVDKKSCEKTLGYYCGEWLAVTKNRIKDSTYVKYFNIVNNHILPALGSLRPEEIDELKIMNFENRLLESGSKQGRPLSPKTVKDILLVLNSISSTSLLTALKCPKVSMSLTAIITMFRVTKRLLSTRLSICTMMSSRAESGGTNSAMTESS